VSHTPHPAALEAVKQAIEKYMDDFMLEQGQLDVAANAAITAYLAALPVDVQAINLAGVNAARASYDLPPFPTPAQAPGKTPLINHALTSTPMSESKAIMDDAERTELFASIRDVYDEEAAQSAGLHKHRPQCLIAVLQHIEAKYYLVPKENRQ
jgi:predicted membrane-bound mannosyltransferase